MSQGGHSPSMKIHGDCGGLPEDWQHPNTFQKCPMDEQGNERLCSRVCPLGWHFWVSEGEGDWICPGQIVPGQPLCFLVGTWGSSDCLSAGNQQGFQHHPPQLVSRIGSYGLHGWIRRWVKKPAGQAQGDVVKAWYSAWRPVPSRELQGSVLQPALFHMF